MLVDRYGLTISTTSREAADTFIGAYDLFFAFQPGGAEAFDAATRHDPNFALAHLGRAQYAAMFGDIPTLRQSVAAADAALGLSEREVSHRNFFTLLFSGRLDAARAAAADHLQVWPRDAAVLNQYGTILGLISTSGLPRLKRLQAEVMGVHAPHYGDDWWFTGFHAMALLEDGQLAAARPVIDTALRGNPNNAVAAHSCGHLAYEEGDVEGGRAFLRSWLAGYPRDGLLQGHLSWHLALTELAAGNETEAFRIYTEFCAPGCSSGPLRIQVYDAIQFLWRWELAGNPRQPERWRVLNAFAQRMLPRANSPFADMHVILANAVAGDTKAMQGRVSELNQFAAERFHAAPIVIAAARGMAEFAEQRFDAAIGTLAPIIGEIERIGGSRAQQDMVEFTLLRAYVEAGRQDKLRAALLARRPSAPPMPIAGLH